VPTPRELQLQFEAWQRMQRQQQGFGVRVAGGAAPPTGPMGPPPIPSGYYDPALDAQRQSASRGLLNTEQDIGLAGRYAQEDYGTAMGAVDRDFNRAKADLDTRGRYAHEDYNRDIEMLTRQYGQLGRRQGEQQRRYGVTGGGGVALLSAAKRAENQALERGVLDTGFNRTVEGLRLAEGRFAEDRDLRRGELTTGYDRGVAGRGMGLSRARSEDFFYGLDVDEQRRYQALLAGWRP
jgi:hypothetical protein